MIFLPSAFLKCCPGAQHKPESTVSSDLSVQVKELITFVALNLILCIRDSAKKQIIRFC